MIRLCLSRREFLSGFFLALHLSTSSAWFWPFKSADPEEFKHAHVRALTNDDFEGHVLKEDGRYYFVKFYANWCGHCKNLAPRWGQVAAENNDSSIEFLQVECSRNNNLCRKAAVKGFPEVKVFYNGRIGYSATGGMELQALRELVHEVPQKVQEGYQKALAREKGQDLSTTQTSGNKPKADEL